MSSNENLGFHYNNTGISLGYAMLAAHALGLGTCWIGYAEMKMNEVKDLQKIVKARGDIFGILTLGYPDVKYHRLPARQAVRIKKY